MSFVTYVVWVKCERWSNKEADETRKVVEYISVLIIFFELSARKEKE